MADLDTLVAKWRADQLRQAADSLKPITAEDRREAAQDGSDLASETSIAARHSFTGAYVDLVAKVITETPRDEREAQLIWVFVLASELAGWGIASHHPHKSSTLCRHCIEAHIRFMLDAMMDGHQNAFKCDAVQDFEEVAGHA